MSNELDIFIWEFLANVNHL